MQDALILARNLQIVTKTDTGALFDAWLDKYSHCRRTQENYVGCWRDFASFLGTDDLRKAALAFVRQPRRIASLTVQRYRSYMLERALTPGTINCRLSAVASFVNYACHDACEIEWTLKVPRLRAENYRDTSGPPRETVAAMIAEAEGRGDRKGKRDAALLRLLHNLGLRRAEAVGIDLEDVDLAGGIVRILGKGHQQKRRLTLDDRTSASLADWLEERGDDAGPLFVNMDRNPKNAGKRLTGRAVAQVVKEHGEAVGATVRPHGLRHSSITSALDATNGNLRDVQKFSRHRKPETIMFYDDAKNDAHGRIAQLVAV